MQKTVRIRDFNEQRDKIIKASRYRQDPRALGLCLSWLQHVPPGDPTIAKAVLCAAIVMSNRSAWRASAFLAEIAFTTDGCEPDTRQRALIQLIRVHSELGHPEVIEQIVSQLRQFSKLRPEIEYLRSYHLGASHLKRQETAVARAFLEHALDSLASGGRSGHLAGTLIAMAQVQVQMKEFLAARATLIRMEGVLGSVEKGLRGHLLINAGDVARSAALTRHAEALYEKGLALAEQTRNLPLVFHANLCLGELALSRDDAAVAHRHTPLLKRHLHRVAHDRDLLQRFWRLMRAL
jgi:hypothetical protein